MDIYFSRFCIEIFLFSFNLYTGLTSVPPTILDVFFTPHLQPAKINEDIVCGLWNYFYFIKSIKRIFVGEYYCMEGRAQFTNTASFDLYLSPVILSV